ncbi:MAG: ribosomal protein S12 methylthiotransferase RimO [Desulfobulbaceae bacterium A2]|nr:MAG: ribosomal protein S12 methylthiotransferase RimO [Desulfobulbaceae bacterium A2]
MPLAKVYLVSLGCPKNLVDSELMLGQLGQQGYEATAAIEEADLILINTCGFIQSAVEEGIETILEHARNPGRRAGSRLVVTGCLVQRYGHELVGELPEVDLFVGTEDFPRLNSLLAQGPSGKLAHDGPRFLMHSGMPRLLATPPHRAYLKITEGCDNRCAYCLIPSIRGPLRSRGLADILAEAARLAAAGVRELTLVAQDLTAYGRDLGLRDGLGELLRQLDQGCSIPWIRLLYLYPTHISDVLLEVIAASRHVLPYLDIPFQHVSDGVLRAMGRGYGRADLDRLLVRIRHTLPQAAVRTTLMVGFPGEGEDDVDQMIDFLQQQQLQHVGVFRYENESGTRAAKLKGRCGVRLKKARYDKVMAVQRGISTALQQRYLGQQVEVLVEGPSRESEHLLEGRTVWQAPDIDGCVYIVDGAPAPGTLAQVRITETHPYDLVGEALD